MPDKHHDALVHIDLTTLNTGATDEAMRKSIVDLCIRAHGLADFENLFSYLPTDGLHVVATESGKVVGHAVVTTRSLQVGSGAPLRTAYVDAVSTEPSMQGRGVGRAVMEKLASSIEDYEIACLETDQPAFYRALGWMEWRGPLAGRSVDGVIPTPDQEGIMILRLQRTPPLNLEEPLSIEVAANRIW